MRAALTPGLYGVLQRRARQLVLGGMTCVRAGRGEGHSDLAGSVPFTAVTVP